MGTINYKSGNIITLGLDMDFDIDNDVINEMLENGYDKDDAINEEKSFYVEDARDFTQRIIDDILKDINEENFDIHIENGYYEGFSVVVNRKYMTNEEASTNKDNLPSFILDWMMIHDDEKDEAKNDLERIKVGLKKLTDNYLDVVYPSWCTTYVHGRNENYKAIDNAILSTSIDLD